MGQYDQLAYQLKPALTGLGFENINISHDLGRGTAFPSTDITLAAGDRFFRTDLNFACTYDGTQWLTMHEYAVEVGYSDVLTFAVGAGNNQRRGTPRSDYKIFLTRGQISITTGATNNGTNYFTYNFVDSNATTNWTFNTSGDANNAILFKTTTSFTQPSSAISFIRLDLATGAGAPSNHSVRPGVLWYRLVVT